MTRKSSDRQRERESNKRKQTDKVRGKKYLLFYRHSL